jgi:hypothetical protein
MGRWISGVAATVIGGVLVYWLTVGVPRKPTPLPQPTPSIPRQPAPLPQPTATHRITKGFLVVFKSSNIHKVEHLRKGDKICTSKSGAEILRSLPSFRELDIGILSASDMFQALQTGVCSAIFVLRREDADKLLPVKVADMRLMEVYGQ